VLEAFPDSRELAMALSGRSQLAMLDERNEEAVALGTRAERLARRAGDDETVAHALTNVGSVLHKAGDLENGRALLEEAFALAVAGGHDDHAARALGNLALGMLMHHRDDPRVAEDIDRGLRFTVERGLDGYAQYLLGARAGLRLLRGAWGAAEQDAQAALALGAQPGVSVCPALIVFGRLQTRRGAEQAAATIEEARRVAEATGELQRLGPVAATRAEHAWLDGDVAGVIAAAEEIHALATRRDDVWARDELAWWLWRVGVPTPSAPPGRSDGPTPYARAVAGDWRGAAAAWAALGFPYERAQVLADADDDDARVEALRIFDDYGALRAAAQLRRRLRAEGMRRIPRGPRAASRAAPAGLTPRQVEVLDLLAAGATNAEIAETLVIAPKTVDHHVSAVLQKLGVASRREAAAAAARLAAAS
jgi:DNA-binding CsgD family transcriptional regulator